MNAPYVGPDFLRYRRRKLRQHKCATGGTIHVEFAPFRPAQYKSISHRLHVDTGFRSRPARRDLSGSPACFGI